MRTEPVNFLERETKRATPPKRRLIFFIVLFAFLLVTAGCVRSIFFGEAIPNDPNAFDPVTLEPKKPEGFFKRIKHFVFSRDISLEGQRADRINVLVMGQGGLGHDGPYLTDTMIIASIKPSTGQIAFVSIPRDLYVKIPGHGYGKINYANALAEANETGTGSTLAIKVVEETFDMPIHYYVRVDFNAFEQLVDTVGNVTVNVERTFTDYEYPAADGEYQTVSFTKGTETMDGARALTFARSRHGNNGEGSDFARSKRQQKIILALKNKILSFETLANPIRIKGIIDTLGEHVMTNMQFADILTFIKLAREVDTTNIITLTLDSSTEGYLVNGTSSIGAFILEPKEGDFKPINTAIDLIFENPPEIKTVLEPVQTPPEDEQIIPQTGMIEIQNGTWQAGLAARAKKKLTDGGFTVGSIGNTNERPYMAGGIYVLTKELDSDMVDHLADTLAMPIKQTPPLGEVSASSTDILIILGEDFQE